MKPDSPKTRTVSLQRLGPDQPAKSPKEDQIIMERLMTIDIDGRDAYRIMRTPGDDLALALGFVFSEGLISGREDILMAAHCQDDPDVVRLRLAGSSGSSSERNLLVVSACGVCGSGSGQEDLVSGLPGVGDSLRIDTGWLPNAMARMRAQQQLFERTGAAHAAALFTAGGDLVTLGEDLGRHNALDKAMGKCIGESRDMSGLGVCLSGRVSFELVAKAARAGIELMAAVSAPTSLAVETAERCNITLCGFVRGERASVYTHPGRIS